MKVTNEMASKEAQAVAEMTTPGTDVTAVAIPQPNLSLAVGGAPYEFSGNVKPPTLSVLQAKSQVVEAGLFRAGDLVLDNNDLLYSPQRGDKPSTPAIRILVVDSVEYYREYVSGAYDSSYRPKTFVNEAAAKRAGLATTWDDARAKGLKGPQASPAMNWAMLIELPEGLTSSLFCIEANGKKYAPARMFLTEGKYRAVETAFGRVANWTHKARGYKTAVFSMGTYYKASKTDPSKGGWVPVIRCVDTLSDEQLKKLSEALSPAQTTVSDADGVAED